MAGTRPYSLNGAIEPTRLSAGYRLGLLVVAVAMLVLPLIYLGLIAGVGWFGWWHLHTNTWIVGRNGNIWRIVMYLAPAVAALILMFFMVKPVLSRAARGVDPVPVSPDSEPVLFQFIQDICRQVGAPSPSRVQVDCQVNASASFARFPVPFTKPSLVLTIGLPLVGGFTVRQLGGVIAHEFGHFAQGGGLRLTYVVRSINLWFSRVVYDRDEWDEKLSRSSEQGHWAVSLTMSLSRGAVWCTRHILRGLMIVGHGISCYMLRQMEYDADSYEIKLVGTRTFLETSARLRELNVHAQLGHRDLHESWIRKTLPLDLPAFLVRQETRVPAEIVAEIRKVPTDATGTFDTHPSDQDRAAAATAVNAVGILDGGDERATVLFQDFDGLSQRATRHHYEHFLYVDLDATSLVDTEHAVQLSQTREDGNRSTHAFYGESASWLRPIRINWPPAPSFDLPSLVTSAAGAREAMTAGAAGVAESYRLMESLEESRTLAAAAEELLQCGFSRVIAADFQLPEGSLKDAQATTARVVKEQQELVPRLEAFELLGEQRLTLGLALAVQLDGSTVSEIDGLAHQLSALQAVWPALTEMYYLTTVFQHVAGNVETCPNKDVAAQRADALAQRIRDAQQRIVQTKTPNGTTVGAVLGADAAASSSLLDRALAIRSDAIGRLTAIALRAEEAIASTNAARA